MIFRWLAVAIDAWLGLRRCLATAWRALPGDLLARLIIRGTGSPAPRRVGYADDVSCLLVEDPRVGRYLDLLRWPIAPYAQTIGGYVFCREPISPYTLTHELEHVRQWRRYGPLFLPMYVASTGLALVRRRDPYRDNRFEAAAAARAEADGESAVRPIEP